MPFLRLKPLRLAFRRTEPRLLILCILLTSRPSVNANIFLGAVLALAKPPIRHLRMGIEVAQKLQLFALETALYVNHGRLPASVKRNPMKAKGIPSSPALEDAANTFSFWWWPLGAGGAGGLAFAGGGA
jgi:hypothetical protein